MQTRYQYIYFERVEAAKGRKTLLFECRNNNSDFILGEVKWYGPWRQYCFFPEGSVTVFNRTCLADVQNFLQELMDRRGKTQTTKQPNAKDESQDEHE
jgi:hypothetical protein